MTPICRGKFIIFEHHFLCCVLMLDTGFVKFACFRLFLRIWDLFVFAPAALSSAFPFESGIWLWCLGLCTNFACIVVSVLFRLTCICIFIYIHIYSTFFISGPWLESSLFYRLMKIFQVQLPNPIRDMYRGQIPNINKNIIWFWLWVTANRMRLAILSFMLPLFAALD